MNKKITLAIDASNIRQGGGVTHLTQLLRSVDIESTNIKEVIVWAPIHTLHRYPVRSWLKLKSPFWINSNPVIRFFTQIFLFHCVARNSSCDAVFSPGGLISFYKPLPVITMSQNLLPFDFPEMNRYGIFSIMWVKLLFLRYVQILSFVRADGVIFLTNYAKNCVKKSLPFEILNTSVIPHGVEARFFSLNRIMRKYCDFSLENPYKVLYVSITMPYKHQIEVACAGKILRDRGFPLEIWFVGPGWDWYHKKFLDCINLLDPGRVYLKWLGEIDFDSLHETYAKADAFIFASSCENMPNILIEAMGSGLPVAASNCGPMPEILGDSGLYFNPNDASSIADTLEEMAKSDMVMVDKCRDAVISAKSYSWSKCGYSTFEFICETVRLKMIN